MISVSRLLKILCSRRGSSVKDPAFCYTVTNTIQLEVAVFFLTYHQEIQTRTKVHPSKIIKFIRENGINMSSSSLLLLFNIFNFYYLRWTKPILAVDHMGERPHRCTTCGDTFKHLIVLKRHVKVVHLKIKETCSLCGNQYTDKKSLHKHQRIHHPEAWSQRHRGGAASAGVSAASKRWRSSGSSSFEKTTFALLHFHDKKYSFLQSIIWDNATNVTNALKALLDQTFCRDTWSPCTWRSDTRVQYVKIVILTKKPWIATLEISIKAAKERNNEDHKRVSIKRVQLKNTHNLSFSICSVTSSSPSKQHLKRRTWIDATPLFQNVLVVSLLLTSSLFAVKHMGDKPYSCGHCGEAFKSWGKMKIHEDQIHLNIKNTCYVCGNTFGSKPIMKRHIRQVHLGIKRKS